MQNIGQDQRIQQRAAAGAGSAGLTPAASRFLTQDILPRIRALVAQLIARAEADPELAAEMEGEAALAACEYLADGTVSLTTPEERDACRAAVMACAGSAARYHLWQREQDAGILPVDPDLLLDLQDLQQIAAAAALSPEQIMRTMDCDPERAQHLWCQIHADGAIPDAQDEPVV